MLKSHEWTLDRPISQSIQHIAFAPRKQRRTEKMGSCHISKRFWHCTCVGRRIGSESWSVCFFFFLLGRNERIKGACKTEPYVGLHVNLIVSYSFSFSSASNIIAWHGTSPLPSSITRKHWKTATTEPQVRTNCCRRVWFHYFMWKIMRFCVICTKCFSVQPTSDAFATA